MAYDVKRLNSIRQGEAEISDCDATVEIVAGMVETMISAHRRTSAALEDRYRNQLRALREVMRRLSIDADVPDSLRAWAGTQPATVPPWVIRGSAEAVFEDLLAGISENQADTPDAPNSAPMSTSDQASEVVFGPQRLMLEAIYRTFVAIGEWPLFQYIAQTWDDPQHQAREVYLDLSERRLVRPAFARNHEFQLQDDTAVAVSLQGLMHLDAAANDLSQFVSIVRYIATRAVDFRPPSPTELSNLEVTSEEIRQHLHLDQRDPGLRRIARLLRDEGHLSNSFATPNRDEWSLNVNLERARRYKDIYTVVEFLDIRYPSNSQEEPWLPSPALLSSTQPVPTSDNKKVMVVHGRDKARDDLFSFLRALGLEPIEWSGAVKATGTTKPYTGQAVEAAFVAAQAAVILLVPEEQVALRSDLRDSKDPSDAQVAWQPRPNVFYEGGIAVTSHPERTIVLELGRPRTATDLAGVNTIRIGSDQGWRHELANRLRDAGCPVNTEGRDWLTFGDFVEPDLGSAQTALTLPASSSSSPDDDRLIEIASAAARAGLGTHPRRDAACLTFLLEKEGMFDSRDVANALPPPKLQVEEFRRFTTELAKSGLIERNPNGQGWISALPGSTTGP